MEKLISSKSTGLQFVPESYILPPETRPRETEVLLCETIPVIDLGGKLGVDRALLTKKIIELAMILDSFSEFFELPAKDKESFYSEDFNQSCRLYTSIEYEREKVHYWRDNLRHPCHPLEEHMQFWPEKPPHYREVMGSYSIEVRKLSLWILDIICEGLGLESGYFSDERSKVQTITINHYPPCPDPSLTLGLPNHSDVNLITFLLQGQEHGLQALKDGKWLAVEPLPNAFVVNTGYMLQMISNEKLRSVYHRVLTNKTVARTTVASFIHPSNNCRIEPAKGLVSDCSPPLYRDFLYKDFLSSYLTDIHKEVPTLNRYKLQY